MQIAHRSIRLFAFFAWAYLSLTANASALDFAVKGTTLTVSGRTGLGFHETDADFRAFKSHVETNKIKVIHFEDMLGGSTTTMGLIIEYMESRAFTTVVSGSCVSACAQMFLAGSQRFSSDKYELKKNAIGFHKPTVSGRTNDSANDWTTINIRRLTGGRFDSGLLNIFLQMETARDMIWFLHPSVENSVRVCRNKDDKFACRIWVSSDTNALKSGIITSAKFYRLE